MQASILTAIGHPTDNFQVGETAKPSADGDLVLIKIAYAACNPVDYKMAHHNFLIPSVPFVLGCDMSGTVVEVGPEVTGGAKVGDKVFAFTRLGTPGAGTFAEFCTHYASMCAAVPKNWSLAEAASSPVGALTAGLGLFHDMGLPLPDSGAAGGGDFILIWGGSTSVGHYAVQLASIAGLRVIATASEANAETVKGLGAEFVIPYTDPEAIAKIDAITGKTLRYAYDTVGAATAQLCANALHHDHSILATIAGVAPSPGANVTQKNVFLGGVYGNPDAKAFVQTFLTKTLLQYIEAGRVRPQPVKVYDGLSQVPAALADVAANRLRGAKAVIRIGGDE